MNLPNKLTVVRVILIIPFIVLLLGGHAGWSIFAGLGYGVVYIALALFIIASLTD